MKVLQPPDWATPKGYANGIAARGELVFTAGLIGWNAQCEFESDDFVEQTRLALENTVAVLAEAQAQPSHIVRMVWYVTDKQAYLSRARDVGAVWRDVIGRHFPAMAVVEVAALMEDRALIEIESIAVVPDRGDS